MAKPVKRRSRLIFRAKRWKIRESDYDDNGRQMRYDFIESAHSALVVALTDDMKVVMLREYRVPVGRVISELPGGSLSGDKPLLAAKRELQEETGITAASWKHLASLNPLTAVTDEVKHIYLAQKLNLSALQPEAAEDISRVTLVPFKDVIHRIETGTMSDGQSITALCIAALKLGVITY